jgi:UDP-N-acetylglucosamine diphosphorylase/glucosamine-1-phosphate N-acetyltransferase
MKLVIFEDAAYEQFYPLTYLRPTFDLRCGSTLLREKVERAFGRKADVLFVREWLREAYAVRTSAKVNDLGALAGDDLVLVNGRGLWIGDDFPAAGRDACAMAGADVVYVTLTKGTAARVQASDFAGFLAASARAVPAAKTDLKLLDYPWRLIEENGAAIRDDFKKLGRSGVHGTLGPTAVIWGPQDQVYVAPGAVVEPSAVIDSQEGPVIIEEGAKVNPHSRIQGPAAIGRDTQVVGGKIREGTTLGPVCRVGGEVEESIIHGYSNKYHDGFLGHAYVCEWVNLGALTTNSDLKNDYSAVEVKVKGQLFDTGSTKVGCFIGDHTKTSIGTLINSGTVLGMMSNILGAGCLLPKSVPSYVMFMDNKFYKAGLKQLIGTARTAMGRRKVTMTPQEEALIQRLFDLTKDDRDELIKKSRKEMMIQRGLR